MLRGFLAYCLVGAAHDAFQLAIDLAFGPEEALQVLHPFKVADGDATGVRQDIWHNGQAAIIEDVIGFGCGGAVGGFDNQAALDPGGIPRGQLILQGGGDQHVTGEFEQLSIGDQLGIRKASQRAVFFGVAQRTMHIDAIGVVHTSRDVADRDNFAFQFIVQQARRDAANVTEALNDDRTLFRDHAEVFHRFARNDEYAARGCLETAFTAANG